MGDEFKLYTLWGCLKNHFRIVDMNFIESKARLSSIFSQSSFEDEVRKGNTHSLSAVVEEFSNGSMIVISFPGYKASLQPRRVFDYRVDLEIGEFVTTLSHANIIVDLFNKLKSGGGDPSHFRNAIVRLATEGFVPILGLKEDLAYTSLSPSEKLIGEVEAIHGRAPFNREGNSIDIPLEELFGCIKWIVLQEDLNYPIERGFEGRKMPIARYLEAIFVAQSEEHSLGEVISRAIARRRPGLWAEMDYSPLAGIG